MSYPPGPNLFIRLHLGLGDSIICNALVRHFTQWQVVIVPCKEHNLASVQFMFRDNPNIVVVPVKDDAEADKLCNKHQWSLKLGMFGDNFSFKDWDAIFYAQAGVPFDRRWTGFYCRREPSSEIRPPHKGPFAFVHEDVNRKMVIDDALLPQIPLVVAERQSTIFAYTACIEEADEIHCIDSAYLSLVESIPTRAKRLVLHRYARPNSKENGYAGPPTLRKNWQVIQDV